MNIKIITVQTNRNNCLDNWIYTAKSNDYDYYILGLDEKWKGWKWRTKKYLNHVEKLNSSDLICLVDCNDLFFVRNSKFLYEGWKYYNDNGSDLIFGGEPTCCTGEFRSFVNPLGRKKVINKINDYNPLNRWMYPNAGCIIGTQRRIVELLNLSKNAEDDQSEYLKKYYEDESWLTIDYEHKIVGNLNAISSLYNTEHMPVDYYNNEMKYWRYVKNYNNSEYENGFDTLNPNSYCLKNIQTNGVPPILHFPGKNYHLYNDIGKELYQSDFKIYQYKDRFRTLWSVKTK